MLQILFIILYLGRKIYGLLCTEKIARERREKHMFICDDILIKALWHDEESYESGVFS